MDRCGQQDAIAAVEIERIPRERQECVGDASRQNRARASILTTSGCMALRCGGWTRSSASNQQGTSRRLPACCRCWATIRLLAAAAWSVTDVRACMCVCVRARVYVHPSVCAHSILLMLRSTVQTFWRVSWNLAGTSLAASAENGQVGLCDVRAHSPLIWRQKKKSCPGDGDHPHLSHMLHATC